MHPALVLPPALGLIVGPRLWARRVLEQHDGEIELAFSAQEPARDLLDRHGLHAVTVESTDRGDHFDPGARSVRLSNHHFDRKSVTALTTAPHAFAHALQHASGFGPFKRRARLASVARPAEKTTRRQSRQHRTPATEPAPRGELEKTLRRCAKPLIRRLLTFPDTQHRAGGVVRNPRRH